MFKVLFSLSFQEGREIPSNISLIIQTFLELSVTEEDFVPRIKSLNRDLKIPGSE